MFYYQAYDALTKGFADAVANNVSLTGAGLCNYLLTVWNITDKENSSCSEVAMINYSDLKLLKPSEQNVFVKFKSDFINVIADKKVIFDNILEKIIYNFSMPAFAVGQQGSGNNEGFLEGCQKCPCWEDFSTNIGAPEPQPGEAGYAPYLYQYCDNPVGQQYGCIVNWWFDSFACTATLCYPEHDNYSCSPTMEYDNLAGRCCPICNNGYRIPGTCECVDRCSCYVYRNSVQSGIVSEFYSECGHNNAQGIPWENACPQNNNDNCTCDFYYHAKELQILGIFTNACGTQNSEGIPWGNVCNDGSPVTYVVGTIYTTNGLKFEFMSDVSFVLTKDENGDDVNSTYFTIKVSKPGSNLADIYFLVYPESKELIPVSPQMIDNRNILPTYLTSDFNNEKNGPVTDYTTYRTARCEKTTKIPSGSNNFTTVIPPAHTAYADFVTSNNMASMYNINYCSGAGNISWKSLTYRNAPRSSLTLKTDSPKAIR